MKLTSISVGLVFLLRQVAKAKFSFTQEFLSHRSLLSDVKDLDKYDNINNSNVSIRTLLSNSSLTRSLSMKNLAWNDGIVPTHNAPLSTSILALDAGYIIFANESEAEEGLQKIIPSVVSRLLNLQVLSLDGNMLGEKALQALSHCARRHPTISYLSLSSCGINDDNIRFVIYCLKMNRNITHLDLSCNEISSVGVEMLVDALREGGAGKSLIALDMSYNNIGDLGALSLTRAFKANLLPDLSYLSLKEVGIGPTAAHHLLSSFQPLSIIEVLDLSGNRIFSVKDSASKKKSKMKYIPSKLQDALLSVSGLVKNSKWVTGAKKSYRTGASKAALKSAESSKYPKLGKEREEGKEEGGASTRAGRLKSQLVRSMVKLFSRATRLRRFSLARSGLDESTCMRLEKILKAPQAATRKGKEKEKREGNEPLSVGPDDSFRGDESSFEFLLCLNGLGEAKIDSLQRAVSNFKRCCTE